MLDLDSKQWNELDHAYGPASDIPKLLQELNSFPPYDDYRAEPYFSLWSSLCHQGSIYSASFAAVPHLLDVCENAPEQAHWSIPQLITCIEISRLRLTMPTIFKQFELDYRNAIAQLPNVVAEMNRLNPDNETQIIFRAASVVADGDADAAEQLLDAEAD
ncbi:MAG: hypothetical protein EX271_09735 [Acidimicrobiales bacterium]|nr:hypothetical protein [Hyphomonadaceae bacterium]RZV40685.1 MAG: hypothetical protein EX271_09735 [Acidimicrobiales bacterium]